MKTTHYQRKPVEVIAEQWHQHGDVEGITPLPPMVHASIQCRFPTERPRLKTLGYFPTPGGCGTLVAPGDWLVTDANGTQAVVKAADFDREFEPMEIEE